MREYENKHPYEDSNFLTVTASREHNLKDYRGLHLTMDRGALNLYDEKRTSDSTYAESIIEQLIEGTMSYARLSLDQKYTLYEYLYKYNPYVGRTVDLHTLLPLSSLSIQKPSNAGNTLVRDYIYKFFEHFMLESDFNGAMLKAVRYYYLYGQADILIMDDFNQTRDTIIDNTDVRALAKKSMKRSKENKEEIDQIVSAYEANPQDISWKDREKVIKSLGFDINTQYDGIKRMIVLHPKDIKEIKRNLDIGYNTYVIKRPTYIDNAFKQFQDIYKWHPQNKLYGERNSQEDADYYHKFLNTMETLGYSRAFVIKMLKTQGKNTYEVDTDPYNPDSMYIATFQRKFNEGEDSSVVNRIMEAAIDYTVARRRDRERANMSYKQNRLFSIKDAGPSQVTQLQNEIQNASAGKQGYDIITNLEINYSDLSLDVKDRMDFAELKANCQQDILTGLGMTDSLLAGGESYSAAFLKVELLSTEYQVFRNEFSKFIQDKLFKPCSVKRAFVTRDEWGYNTIITPTIRFDRMSIARGTEDFNLILQLVQGKMLPVKSLLKQLGFDYDEVQNDLTQESTSIFNTNVDMANGAAMQQLAMAISSEPAFIEKIAETLKLPPEFIDKAAQMAQAQAMAMMPPPMEPVAPGEEPQPEIEQEPTEQPNPEQLAQAVQNGDVTPEQLQQAAQEGQLDPTILEQVMQLLTQQM